MMKSITKNIKPNLFIVGASKCGTTALSEYLRSHPDIFVAKEKEVHYFCFDFNERYPRPRSINAYLDTYTRVRSERIIVDASPWYLLSKDAIEAAYQFNPRARFIAMVRSPFDMLPSLHRQLINNGDEDQIDLLMAWRLQSKRLLGENIPAHCREEKILQYKKVCLLGEQINVFFQTVPSEQRMVILLDDLKSSPRWVYKKVLSFLGLPDDGRSDFPVVNASFHWRYKGFSEFVLKPPRTVEFAGAAILKLIGRDRIGLFRLLYHINNNFNRRQHERDPLPRTLLAELKQPFNSDIKLLGQLLGRNLNGWLK